jgi:hypothetical protein
VNADELLDAVADCVRSHTDVESVTPYRQDGAMQDLDGVTVRCTDGSAYELTLVQTQ